MAIMLGRAFGSGMGQGGICGVLVGAFMILALTFQEETDERWARYRTYDLVREFTGRFTTRRGTLFAKSFWVALIHQRKLAGGRPLTRSSLPPYARSSSRTRRISLERWYRKWFQHGSTSSMAIEDRDETARTPGCTRALKDHSICLRYFRYSPRNWWYVSPRIRAAFL
jgi:hypothetical protein